MRTLIAPAAALALFGACGPANAQRVDVAPTGAPGVTWQDAPPVSRTAPPPPVVAPPVVAPAPGGARWRDGGGERWSGGARAPGGWAAYRRPVRGRKLPPYWVAPDWYVADWAGRGLPEPPYGYRWSRYYDDAVLIDTYGRVFDSVGGVNWGRHDMPPPAQPLPPPVVTRAPNGATVVTTSTVGPTPGYYADGYYYPAPTVTTVTIQSAPKVGVSDQVVTYTRTPAKRPLHRRKRHRR
ncbi:RcnB family protein [Sphingomonas sp. TX0543]|uniref:RcnB family protein n=1 Tax=unclassified Sphingomonas TaxID=196159 RepID=UPI0010F4C153|nr:RcnB family protein [Sphingomonas sp. 3P27F8]